MPFDWNEVEIPHFARLSMIRAWVNYGNDLREVINQAGPDTDDKDRDILSKVKSPQILLPGSIEKNYVLLSYPDGDARGGLQVALSWAESVGLEQTIPWEVFSIGKQYPTLNQLVGLRDISVISTTRCVYNTVDNGHNGGKVSCWPGVFWSKSTRKLTANFSSPPPRCLFAFCE